MANYGEVGTATILGVENQLWGNGLLAASTFSPQIEISVFLPTTSSLFIIDAGAVKLLISVEIRGR
jgi:hypothetical protein